MAAAAVMRGARRVGPFADRACVDVDELGVGVVADAAGLEAQRGLAQKAGVDNHLKKNPSKITWLHQLTKWTSWAHGM